MRAWTVALVAAIPFGSASAVGATLEELVSPGPVIQGHAEFESECGRCHVPFDRPGEDERCLDCHEDVAADRKQGVGFHGRVPGLAEASCRSCHSEHRGRDADVVGLDAATFDHRHTDYPLEGAHRIVDCASCHAAEDLPRDAASECVACHREDDAHRKRLGEACGDCHHERAWRDASFDHAATDFPLRGAHEAAPCALCHADERYAETPAECASCHRLDDVHQGRFGSACGDCHDDVSWIEPAFDHDQQTKFSLVGGHRGIDCASCHPGNLFTDGLGTDCASCHEDDDPHRGARSSSCEKCHSVTAWAEREFDHDRDTEFALLGRHERVRCGACHDGVLYESETPDECSACHAKDDVHAGQLGEACGECHAASGWGSPVVFDHQLTSFPLLGLHRAVTCEECHASQAFRDAELECVACHLPVDAHEKRLGSDCASCHNPNGWNRWRFDHDARTTFALHGAHEGADCLSCHEKPVAGPIELSHVCADCHALDDVHDGAFGADCRRCHIEKTWDEVRVPR